MWDLKEIIASLFVHAQLVTGTADLGLPTPEVLIVPEQTIVQKACGNAQCGAVKGWFSNLDDTIYLPNTLSVRFDPHAQSILLHEMIHYIQHRTDNPKLENSCLTWKVRESQAYKLQYEWLYANKVPVRTPAFNYLLASFRGVECPPA